jgi:outer membrane cobalamin receptor
VKNFYYSFILGIAIVSIPLARADKNQELEALLNLSLEELMNIEVSVGSKAKEKSLRESPGIISVIGAKEIANSGARDLIDVLRLVPGFNFGVDIFNVVGVGVRGGWAHEGKVLLLIDGIQMNERNFGSFVLGNHYPMEHIDKIEIIRGPGSVNYGGLAELGVINIITKSAEKVNGTQINLTYGQMTKSIGRQNLSFMYGDKLKDDLKVTVAGYVGKGNRSDGVYTDSNGVSASMKNSSELNPHFVNVGLEYGDFSSRLLVDNYRTTNRDGYGTIIEQPWRTDFQTWSYQAKYNKSITKDLKFTADAGYTHDVSWATDNGLPEGFTRTIIEHLWLKNNLRYSVSNDFAIATGIGINFDKTVDKSLINPKSIPHFHYYNLFVEGDYKSDLGNITMGLRYDNHNLFGGNFAPRVALTKAMDKFHYKLLYSHAFRTPMSYNVALNPQVKPEKTAVFEAEVGYQIHKKMSLVVNVFDNKTKDTIVYDLLPITNQESYFNADKTGTLGAEIEWRFKDDWGDVMLSHSYYRSGVGTANTQKVVDFQDGSEQKQLHLGLPAHKSVLKFNFKLSPHLNLNSSMIYNSVRYGYDGIDENGLGYLKKYTSSPLFNLFLRYKPPSIKGLDVGIGVYDVLNSKPPFIQPYNAGHSPLPSPSREIVLKLGYQF